MVSQFIGPFFIFLYDENALITPGIGKRIFIRRLVAIESTACYMFCQVNTDHCWFALTMSMTINLFTHFRNIFLRRFNPDAGLVAAGSVKGN